MARVNVETRALAEGRFSKLVDQLKVTRAEAIGTLVIFWHDTQERGLWKGTRARLLKFIPFAASQCEGIFDALVEHEYISLCPDGDYVIHGNKKHIEAIQDKKASGAKGGVQSGKVRSGQKPKKNKSDEAPASNAEAPASSAEPNALQCNAIHNNTKQGKKAPLPLPPLAEIWNKNCGNLPKVQACGKLRTRKANELWKENPSTEYWTEIIIRMSKSDFCLGKKNSEKHPNWIADFDFLLQPETQNKVREGKYDNRGTQLIKVYTVEEVA
jgi:hypothetical protein